MTALVARYRSAVLAYFRRRVFDEEAANDLTQDVFAALLRQTHLHQIDNIEGYIFRTASNLLKDRARKARKGKDVLAELAVQSSSVDQYEIDPERIAIGRDSYERAIAALHHLPERQRTIFVLNRFERMSGREIAQSLSVSISLVEKELIVAARFLRDRLS